MEPTSIEVNVVEDSPPEPKVITCDASTSPVLEKVNDRSVFKEPVECLNAYSCAGSSVRLRKDSRHSIGGGAISSVKDRLCGTTSNSLSVGDSKNTALAKSRSEVQVCISNSLSVSQTSRNSLMTYSSSGTFYDHSRKKSDVRIPPKTPPQPPPPAKVETDFRQMEKGLLQLLEDFHCGKLEGFGQNCTFEKMENVREQQEKLARLHFDLNAQQENCGQHTDEGIKVAKNNLARLMNNLQQLSLSIEQLQSVNQGLENSS